MANNICIQFMKYCGQYSARLHRAAESFPRSPFLRDKYLRTQGGSISFQQFIPCQKCHSLYKYCDCIEKVGTLAKPKACSNVVWAKQCRQPLLREVVSVSGNTQFYPYRVYCYHSVVNSLQRLLLRPGFVDLCESTRKSFLDIPVGYLRDVYHARIWREFLKVDGKELLALPLTYAFVMNIDWFEPFEHVTYSVGVIYLAVLNLPRPLRYKRENIILVGIIPGPSEPHLSINTYLSPLVTELVQLWEGLVFRVHGYATPQSVRSVLLMVGCDLPAARKVCGFPSHSANLGCSRCFCSFSRGFGNIMITLILNETHGN